MLHPKAGSIRFDSAEDLYLDHHQATTAIWRHGNKSRYSCGGIKEDLADGKNN